MKRKFSDRESDQAMKKRKLSQDRIENIYISDADDNNSSNIDNNSYHIDLGDDIIALIKSFCHSVVIISNKEEQANKVLQISSLFMLDDWIKRENIKGIYEAILLHETQRNNSLFATDEEGRESMRQINWRLQKIEDVYDTYLVNTIYKNYSISIYFKLECGLVSLYMDIENKQNINNIGFKTITINNTEMELDQYQHFEETEYALSTVTNAYGWRNRSIYSAFVQFFRIVSENDNMMNIHMTFTED